MTPEEASSRYDRTGRMVVQSGNNYIVVLRDDLPLTAEVVNGQSAAVFRESELPFLRSLSREALTEEIRVRKGTMNGPALEEFIPPPPPPPPRPKKAPTPEQRELLANVLDIMDGRLLGPDEIVLT